MVGADRDVRRRGVSRRCDVGDGRRPAGFSEMVIDIELVVHGRVVASDRSSSGIAERSRPVVTLPCSMR